MPINVIILAAGQGTRMNSELPKVLHPLAGAPLIVHSIRSAQSVEPDNIVIVTGHGSDAVTQAAQAYDPSVVTVSQTKQRGTGHAVLQSRAELAETGGDALVLFGDTPFIEPETLQSMLRMADKNDVVVLGFEPKDAKRYGRLVMSGNSLERIVEYKDATDAQRALTLCNGGVVVAKTNLLFDLLDQVTDDNAAGEYYLTDIVAVAQARGLSATAVTCSEAETQGINTRADLARAEGDIQTRMRARVQDNGASLIAPETVHLSFDTEIGRDAIIEPNVVFGTGVSIETGATIRAFSHLEGCHVARGAVVGPYARLRPGTELAEDSKIGNFVEVKNAFVGEGAKVNHLSYIGDAAIGAQSNIGAGTITCNYDGVMKHRTEIGERVFVGSNTMLVAPVMVGDEAMTASGSIITGDVDPGAMAIARVKQVNKPGLARKLFDRLRATKAAREKGKG